MASLRYKMGCSICLDDPPENPVMTVDGAVYCLNCITQWFETGKSTSPSTGNEVPQILIPATTLCQSLNIPITKIPPIYTGIGRKINKTVVIPTIQRRPVEIRRIVQPELPPSEPISVSSTPSNWASSSNYNVHDYILIQDDDDANLNLALEQSQNLYQLPSTEEIIQQALFELPEIIRNKLSFGIISNDYLSFIHDVNKLYKKLTHFTGLTVEELENEERFYEKMLGDPNGSMESGSQYCYILPTRPTQRIDKFPIGMKYFLTCTRNQGQIFENFFNKLIYHTDTNDWTVSDDSRTPRQETLNYLYFFVKCLPYPSIVQNRHFIQQELLFNLKMGDKHKKYSRFILQKFTNFELYKILEASGTILPISTRASLISEILTRNPDFDILVWYRMYEN